MAKASPKRRKTTSRSSTRTASRSAKRRSPKEGAKQDPEQLEVERLEFLRAMDRYKRKTGKTFPSWTEVLEVLRSIGWISPARFKTEIEKNAPTRKAG